jgi:hypothetical protein
MHVDFGRNFSLFSFRAISVGLLICENLREKFGFVFLTEVYKKKRTLRFQGSRGFVVKNLNYF